MVSTPHRHPWLDEAAPFPGRDAGAARAAASARARALHEAVREACPEWDPPPYDPFRFAEVLGVGVRRVGGDPPWDALVVPDLPRPVVLLNGRIRSPGRLAFSLAHELAHLFFSIDEEHRRFLRLRKELRGPESEEERALERACDVGAAALTLPRPEFDGALARVGLTAGAAPALAEEFSVSSEAAAFRVAEVTGGAAGFFHYAAQPSLEAERGAPGRYATYRARRVFHADGFPFLFPPGRYATYRARRVFHADGFPFLFPPGKSVPETSAIYRASLSRGEIEAVEEYALGSARAVLHVRAVALPPHRDSPPLVSALFCTPGVRPCFPTAGVRP